MAWRRRSCPGQLGNASREAAEFDRQPRAQQSEQGEPAAEGEQDGGQRGDAARDAQFVEQFHDWFEKDGDQDSEQQRRDERERTRQGVVEQPEEDDPQAEVDQCLCVAFDECEHGIAPFSEVDR